MVRGSKREFISRAYNLILRSSLAAGFSDAQCGFKAIRREVAQRLLPMVEDTGWFFDTEMLVLAERAGLRIHEVPVDWVDDPDSTVHIVRTATDDLKGVWRVGRAMATGALPLDRLARPFGDDPRDRAVPGVPRGLARQLVSFCVVGRSRPSSTSPCTPSSGSASAHSSPTRRPCWSPPSPTRRPTVDSPSAYAAGEAPCATRRRASSSSRSGSP